MTLDAWVALVIGCAMIAFLWKAAQPKWTIQIVVDESGVKSHGGLAKAQTAIVVEFLERDVSFEGKVVVSAMRDGRGYLRTRFAGRLDPGTKQRIRNFLASIL